VLREQPTRAPLNVSGTGPGARHGAPN